MCGQEGKAGTVGGVRGGGRLCGVLVGGGGIQEGSKASRSWEGHAVGQVKNLCV